MPVNGMAGCANISRTSICVGDAHPAPPFFIPAPKGLRDFFMSINQNKTIMKPPKTVVEHAKQNGSIDRASLLLSAAYLLNSEASNLIEEAGDILRREGLMLGEIKHLQNNFTVSATRYFTAFSQLVTDRVKVMDYFNDLTEFDRRFRAWAKIDNQEGGRV